jgi:hypothetical protein
VAHYHLPEVRGIAANAVGQSNDHILNFFRMLRTELALCATGFPVPNPREERCHSVRGLYNVCLTLKLRQSVLAIALHNCRIDITK